MFLWKEIEVLHLELRSVQSCIGRFVCSPQRVCWPAILDEMKENEGKWLS